MRTAAVVAATLTLAAAGGAGYLWYQQSEQDRAAASVFDQLAAGWSAQDVSSVPFVKDDAAASFTPATEGLSAESVSVQADQVRRDGERATADLSVKWTLPGGVTWAYTVPTAAQVDGEGWRISPPSEGAYWHPGIKPGDTMKANRVDGVRGDLLDRNGEPLMPLGTVYPVQLDPNRATAQTATALEALVKAEPGSLLAKLQAANTAGSKSPIPVITYRESDFTPRRAQLDALTGVIYPKTVQPLASDREFGQPLLGSYGDVTAEIVEASKGRYQAGDRAGISGLQRTYDEVLSGEAGLKVNASTGKILFEQKAVDGNDVALTLDPTIQKAAEKALSVTGEVPSALVAIDVPSGEVRAVANHPWFGFDRAQNGQYPPGSTFKIASTYALLTAAGVQLTDAVSCPATVTVQGKVFRNFEGETLGSPTFADDVTHSCNTAFVQLSKELGENDLSEAARALGLGAGWAKSYGVPGVFDGSVPATTSAVDQAAATIGQGRDLASPLSLAVMTASVARGSYLPPLLVREPAAEGAGDRSPSALQEKAVTDLRTALRSVVTSGTATALASAPGGPVSGKTGTAEFGSDSPPKTHAWFVGYQGDLAFAVLVEEGRSGGAVAAPIAKSFLTEVN